MIHLPGGGTYGEDEGVALSSDEVAQAALALTGERRVIPYKPRNWARGFHGSYARWLCLVMHRRGGKTTSILNHHQRACLNEKWERRRLKFLEPSYSERDLDELCRGRKYGHVLPTLKQAKLVAWDMLKYFAGPVQGAKFNESELSVTYPGGHKLFLFGADNPDGFRGVAFSGISFDEYSQHPPKIFSEVVSKGLADHLGYAIFAGTIKGKNQLYQTYEAARLNPGAWFSLWQDVDASLRQESGPTITALRRAMADDQDLVRQGLMTQEEYEQEWFLSVEAAIKGAYYGKQLAAARKEGRIGRVPFDPDLPVNTDWDLGINDQMTIWFSQELRGRETRLIDYYENSGEGLPHYIGVLQEKASTRGYVYGKHYAPHDIKVREMSSGKTRLQIAEKLGIKFEVTPSIGVMDGINAARALLPKCYFDEEKCRVGLEALTHYRKEWNEKMRVFGDKPVHDWSSNGADSFRGLAVRGRPAPPRGPSSARSRQHFAPKTGAAGLGWMK